ncbi:YbaB/EbfC family DNA-binding protein [Mycobacterium sp. SM1]|uniref:YbaB/EbfC family DNA-binding protein n=1 Tax=Mycobacterium sp. SM1 TaxID=2816243 RepID=UPI001BCF036A|nr:YbaB/EbfC family DNA-binding protein [Mycobacterium sp. SM1]MBS4728061.1 YbaB/EbfC family DNA-binding protein [Mycobacterium sp. SM1]
MVDDTSRHLLGNDPPTDDEAHDNLAALDFTVPDDSEVSALEAFDMYAPAEDAHDAGGDLEAIAPPGEDEAEGLSVPLFTVTNPPGTVSVSALMGGRAYQIELSAKATNMTEQHLAEEIVVIAGLARQKARSAQYAFMLEGMRELGHDGPDTQDFLSRELELPTPEQATAATASVFATRYAGDHG